MKISKKKKKFFFKILRLGFNGDGYLSMKERSNGEIPRSISSHNESKKRPDSVIFKGRNKNCSCTTSSKYVCPGSLV